MYERFPWLWTVFFLYGIVIKNQWLYCQHKIVYSSTVPMATQKVTLIWGFITMSITLLLFVCPYLYSSDWEECCRKHSRSLTAWQSITALWIKAGHKIHTFDTITFSLQKLIYTSWRAKIRHLWCFADKFQQKPNWFPLHSACQPLCWKVSPGSTLWCKWCQQILCDTVHDRRSKAHFWKYWTISLKAGPWIR